MSPTGDPSSVSSTPLLLARQRTLLALLHALGGNVGNLDFQKLLFLYCKQLCTDTDGPRISPYEFVPYRFGAFSFTCYADRRRLMEQGLLMDDSQKWVLSEHGTGIAEASHDRGMSAFAHRYQGLRGHALIAETYRRYPYYAIRSEVAGDVLGKDSIALSRILEARPVASSSQLFTIGYQGRTLESYLSVLIQQGVTLLCDVRKNAISRKYGFSKRTLARACEGVGIRYEHLPELGIESRQRKGLKTPSEFKALFSSYERSILPQQEAALDRIRAWLRAGDSVALTCFEREAGQCHRHCVAGTLAQVSESIDHSDGSTGAEPDDQGYIARHL